MAHRGEDGLPAWDIPIMLIDAMRVTPRGHAGWRLRPPKLDRQPLFIAYLLVKLEPRPLCSLQATKRRSTTIPPLTWAMADCAFSRQRSHSLTRISVRASCTVYCVLSRTLQFIH
jgi:hypothetical protein